MLEIFIYSYFTSIYVFSAGIFFSNKIIDLKKSEGSNIFQVGLYGIIFLSFVSLLINFFYPLNKNINTFIFIFFIFYLFLEKGKYKKVLVYSIYTGFICTLLMSFDTTYRPDAGLYHLPYTNIINNEKIIIGLSNIHFRFGHTSIIQYISALNNNWIFHDKGILIPLSIIYAYFLLYLIFEIRSEKNKIILFFNYLVLSFLCLKLNRYSDFGNDAPAHIFYFFLICISLKSFKNFSKVQMGEMLSVSAYIIFNKITLFLGCFIPFIILFSKKKFFFVKFKVLFFIILFSFTFFLKNFLVSGCLAFPIEQTCFSKVFWYDSAEKRGSNAKITMLENEAWTKGWSDQKENRKEFKEYISDFNWVKLWSENHGKRLLNKLIPYLIILIILIFVIYKNSFNKNYLKKNYLNVTEKNIYYAFFILNIIGSLMWFFKFPVFRYGSSYLISAISILTILICWRKIFYIELNKIKKILTYFSIFVVIILFSKSSLRIIKNYDQVYNQKPWPKIYSEDKKNTKKKNIPIYKNKNKVFYQSSKGLCYYNTAPCTHMLNSQFTKEEINLTKKWNYKVFYFSKT